MRLATPLFPSREALWTIRGSLGGGRNYRRSDTPAVALELQVREYVRSYYRDYREGLTFEDYVREQTRIWQRMSSFLRTNDAFKAVTTKVEADWVTLKS